MTIREFYVEAMNCEALSEDARAIARKYVEKDAEARDAKTAENVELEAKIRETLKAAGHPMKSTEIGAAVGAHFSKVTYILKGMDDVTVGETIEKGRVLKTYAI